MAVKVFLKHVYTYHQSHALIFSIQLHAYLALYEYIILIVMLQFVQLSV